MRRLVFTVDLPDGHPLPPPDTIAEVAFKVGDKWYWLGGLLREVAEVGGDDAE